MPNLFTYLDYRKFLKDTFEEFKNTKRGFSHRSFARMADFSSSNYILLVMQGKRNLSGDGILKVARALKLKRAEAEFFEFLVRFNQAASDSERNFYYARISANRQYASAHMLEREQFDYYSKWYIPAIREMVLLKDFKEDPEWIARRLGSAITSKDAKSALELLLRIGLLVRNESGRLVQNEAHIASGDEVASLAMTNFQREMIERAAVSIEKTPEGKREIGSITFAVSKEKFAEAKRMMRDFRSRLAGFLTDEAAADAVYQFNFQFFNLSEDKE